MITTILTIIIYILFILAMVLNIYTILVKHKEYSKQIKSLQVQVQTLNQAIAVWLSIPNKHCTPIKQPIAKKPYTITNIPTPK